MYRKILLIGLGGSGGKTLRFLRRDLEVWLESRGWTDGIPQAWQFLHIDSPPTPDGLEAGGTPLRPQDYLGLVTPAMRLRPVIENLDRVPGAERELAGWRVDPDDVRVPIAGGAGQYRALGRSIGLSFSGSIRDGLVQSAARMNSAGAQAQLDALYQRVHGKSAEPKQAAPIPIIISSLAGGTGAGLLLDVLDLLRSVEPSWADQSIGLWYTPDVFPTNAGDGVYPNSLAAICELLNGAWWGANATSSDPRSLTTIPIKEPKLTAALAKAESGLSRTGAHCNYLIGSTNASGASIATDGTLFEMVGGALLAWVTDPKVQQTFVAYQVANWSQLANSNIESQDVVTNEGSAGERGLPAFSALGFARLSVGTKYLRLYAAQRLAKDAASQLAEAHVLSDRARQESRVLGITNPDRLVERLVEIHLPRFRLCLDVTGRVDPSSMSESVSVDELVERALTSPALSGWLEEQHHWILAQESTSRPKPGSEWIDALAPAIRESQRVLEQRVRDSLPGIVDEWIRGASVRLPADVEEASAAYGLRVASGLVEAICREIDDTAVGSVVRLLERTADYRAWSSRDQVLGSMREVFDQTGVRAKLGSESELVTEAVRHALHRASFSALALIAERSAILLERASQGLLMPMAEALREGMSDLEATAGEREAWPDWSDGLPPQQVLPPRSEFTVLESKDFAATFTSLLEQTYVQQGAVLGRREVREDVAGGRAVRRLLEPLNRSAPERERLEPLTFFVVEHPWIAGFEVTGDGVAAHRAVFRARCRSQELLQRSDHWLMRPDYPFASLLASDLRSYTRSPDGSRDDAPEYRQRQARVLETLDHALAASAPLVELQEDLLSLLHPSMSSSDGGRFTQNLSMVPFRGHPLESRVRDRLLSSVYSGTRAPELDTLLTQDADMPHIDIISSLRMPVSPLVVASLMRPIGEEWMAARADLGRRKGFWQHRRSRPLREFVPVPQRHLRCFLRGWFTARLLGLIDVSSTPFRILEAPLGTNPRVVSFPSEMLSPDTGDVRDQPAMVLEALALAMVEVGRVSSVEPLAAYRALRDLGMSVPRAGSILEYSTPNPVLQVWLETGEIAGAHAADWDPRPHRLLAGDDLGERRASLDDLLKRLEAEYERRYEQYLDEVRADRRKLGRPPYWPGIHDEMQVALKAMRGAIAKVAEDDIGL